MHEKNKNNSDSIQSQLDALVFTETPTTIIEEVVKEYEAQQSRSVQVNESFLALSKIGHKIVGEE